MSCEHPRVDYRATTLVAAGRVIVNHWLECAACTVRAVLSLPMSAVRGPERPGTLRP